MVDKFLMVVATDDEGNTDEAVTSAPVKADASSDVSIVDEMGLQSDGTGIIGDTLRLSYGVTFGTPTAITWYKNGAAIVTWGSGNGDLNNDGGIKLDVTAARGTGTYQATVIADGLTYTTNEIIITNKEEAAEILAFTLEDDYTDGTAITYDTADKTAVATITLKKNYDGKLAIYKATDNKYKGVIDSVYTQTDAATKAAKDYVATAAGGGNTAIAGNKTVLTTDQATNYQVENLATLDASVGHINADGTVTYKFVVDDGILTRGQQYVAVFDQASLTGDTPGTGVANVFETPATAPYVTAPAQIAVTKVSAGNYPEISFQDEDGATLAWFGEAGTNGRLSQAGIDKGEIYYAKSKLNDPKKGTKQGVNIATNDNVDKGVWKSDVKAAAIVDAYWFAEVTTKKGIFGEKAATLTSEAVPVAQKAASTINLVESGTTATTATVKFTNLRANGTVFVVRGLMERTEAGKNRNAWNGTDYHTTPADVFKAYEAGITEAIVGKADVEAGAASVDVASTLEEYANEALSPDAVLGTNTAGYYGVNNYIAVFVPDDEDNYGMIYTTDGFANKATKEDSTSSDDSQGMNLSQIATTLKYPDDTATKNAKDTFAFGAGSAKGSVVISDDALIAYDQFGSKMILGQAKTDVTSVTVTNKDITTDEKANATFTVAANTGVISITIEQVSGAALAIDKGDGFTVSLLGSTVSVMATNTETALSQNNSNGLVVKIGSETQLTGKYGTQVGSGANTVLTTDTATSTFGTATVALATATKVLDADGALFTDGTADGKATLYTDATLTTSAGKTVTMTDGGGTLTATLDDATMAAGTYYFKYLGCTYTLTHARKTLTATMIHVKGSGDGAAQDADLTVPAAFNTGEVTAAGGTYTFSAATAESTATFTATIKTADTAGVCTLDGLVLTVPSTAVDTQTVVVTLTGTGNYKGTVDVTVTIDNDNA